MRRGPRRLLSSRGRIAPARIGTVLGTAAITLAIIVSGCGSRGPLDDTPLVDASADTGIGIDAPATVPPVDAGLEAGIAACGVCVLSTCADGIFGCLGSAACLGVFQCVLSTCVAPPAPPPTDAGPDAEAGAGGGGGGGGGGIDSACLLGCAATDPAGALQVLAIFQCVTGSCGSPCGPVLGGLGGGIPGLPGGRERERTYSEIFAPWPALTTPPATR